MLSNWVPKFGHEVYVLTPEEIARDQTSASPNIWQALQNSDNLKVFFVAGLVALTVFTLLFWLKKTNAARKTGRFLDGATAFAPDIIRVAFGASLIFSAYHNALYGPELPLKLFAAPQLLDGILMVCGVALIAGFFSRWFALLAGTIFVWAMAQQGWYMLNYVNYLGEAIAVWLFPVQKFSADRLIQVVRKAKLTKPRFEQYSLPVARILFGFSVLYAAVNVKFATTNLSLDVVDNYELTKYLHFDPMFIVLGALLMEAMIGVLYMLGLFNRFNSVLFLFFLILSINFFNEDVWPHYLLIALALGIFLHSPDKLSVDKKLK